MSRKLPWQGYVGGLVAAYLIIQRPARLIYAPLVAVGAVVLWLVTVGSYVLGARLSIWPDHVSLPTRALTRKAVLRSSIGSLFLCSISSGSAGMPTRRVLFLDHKGKALGSLPGRFWGTEDLEKAAAMLGVPVTGDYAVGVTGKELELEHGGTTAWERNPDTVGLIQGIALVAIAIAIAVAFPTR